MREAIESAKMAVDLARFGAWRGARHYAARSAAITARYALGAGVVSGAIMMAIIVIRHA